MVKTAAAKSAAVEPAMKAATMKAATVEAAAMETTTAMRCFRGYGLDQCEDTCQSDRSKAQATRRADAFHICLLPYIDAESGVYRKRLARTLAGRWPPDEIGFICWPARTHQAQADDKNGRLRCAPPTYPRTGRGGG
jgi:hypothetical protein